MDIRHRTTGEVLKTVPGDTLRGADLRGTSLWGADLCGTDLTGANLSGADLDGADLGDANLSRADLHGANLGCTNLSNADLSGAELGGAYLRGANIEGACLGLWTRGPDGYARRREEPAAHPGELVFQRPRQLVVGRAGAAAAAVACAAIDAVVRYLDWERDALALPPPGAGPTIADTLQAAIEHGTRYADHGRAVLDAMPGYPADIMSAAVRTVIPERDADGHRRFDAAAWGELRKLCLDYVERQADTTEAMERR